MGREDDAKERREQWSIHVSDTCQEGPAIRPARAILDHLTMCYTPAWHGLAILAISTISAIQPENQPIQPKNQPFQPNSTKIQPNSTKIQPIQPKFNHFNHISTTFNQLAKQQRNKQQQQKEEQ